MKGSPGRYPGMANDAATPNYRDLAQRLLSSVARPERYTFQRQLQSVAIDLMFGVEPALLIARLVELGAPPVEARRIIETANKDPLIANGRAMALTLRKRDWLLDALEQQQRLWPAAG